MRWWHRGTVAAASLALAGCPTWDNRANIAAGGGGGGADRTCCVDGPSVPYERITLVAFGSPAPACPASSPKQGFVGHEGLTVPPLACPTCKCSPAACALPEPIHASAAKCVNAPGAAEVPFDAPPGWEGTCTNDGAIAAGEGCDGPECAVQSVTIAPLPVAPCEIIAEGGTPPAPLSWQNEVRECLIWPLPSDGCGTGQVCAPPVPPGFKLCQFLVGAGSEVDAIACPAGFEDRHVVYAGTTGTQACTPCACGPRQGGACKALVSLFTDSACADMLGAVTITDSEGACVDVPSGSALGSKAADMVADIPGECEPSGGEPAGDIAPSRAVTFCCQPDLPESE